MTETRRHVLRGIGAGSAIALGAGSASALELGDDDESDPAEVRVIHASPDAPAVDVFIDGDAILEGITFKTVSEYLDVPAGTYDVAVAPAGAGVDNAVIDTELTVDAGTDYTVAAANRLANIAPLVFVDDNVSSPRSFARLRVIHLSPNAPGVDVFAIDGPPLVDEEHPRELVDGITYQNATGYLGLDPYDYELEIRPDGADTSVFQFELDPEVSATYTAFAVGLLGGSGKQAFDVVPSVDVPPISDRDFLSGDF